MADSSVRGTSAGGAPKVTHVSSMLVAIRKNPHSDYIFLAAAAAGYTLLQLFEGFEEKPIDEKIQIILALICEDESFAGRIKAVKGTLSIAGLSGRIDMCMMFSKVIAIMRDFVVVLRGQVSHYSDHFANHHAHVPINLAVVQELIMNVIETFNALDSQEQFMFWDKVFSLPTNLRMWRRTPPCRIIWQGF